VEIALVVAGIVVAVVAGTTAVIQVTHWIWDRGYRAGRRDAYQKAERAAQAQVATDVQALRRRLESITDGNVGVADLGDRLIGVRDTKDVGSGPVLVFSDAAWRSFLDDMKNGD